MAELEEMVLNADREEVTVVDEAEDISAATDTPDIATPDEVEELDTTSSTPTRRKRPTNFEYDVSSPSRKLIPEVFTLTV
jgi:hypothetical protein